MGDVVGGWLQALPWTVFLRAGNGMVCGDTDHGGEGTDRGGRKDIDHNGVCVLQLTSGPVMGWSVGTQTMVERAQTMVDEKILTMMESVFYNSLPGR